MNRVSTGAISTMCMSRGIFGGSLAWGACKVFRAQSRNQNSSRSVRGLGFLGCGVVPLQYTSKHMVVSLMRLDSTLGDETRRIFSAHVHQSTVLGAVKAESVARKSGTRCRGRIFVIFILVK